MSSVTQSPEAKNWEDTEDEGETRQSSTAGDDETKKNEITINKLNVKRCWQENVKFNNFTFKSLNLVYYPIIMAFHSLIDL